MFEFMCRFMGNRIVAECINQRLNIVPTDHFAKDFDRCFFVIVTDR